MSRLVFYTLDVFTDRIFGGNPLAVIPNAVGLTTEQMQAVAREFNLSETVFVFAADHPAHTRRLRIFTPATELPFAGHPTVGTAHLLAEIGDVPLDGPETHIVFEEGVGPVPVTIRAADGSPQSAQFSAARLPEFGPPAPTNLEISDVLSLAPDDVSETLLPAAVSCGVPFLFVMLNSLHALGRAKLRRDQWERILAESWAPDLYLVVSTGQGGCYRARMFAPSMAIDEDPATGAAATALAGYLAPLEDQFNGTVSWLVEQGVEMGRPSRISVEADLSNGDVTAVRVSGRSVVVSQGEITIP